MHRYISIAIMNCQVITTRIVLTLLGTSLYMGNSGTPVIALGHTMKVAYKVWLDNDGKAFGEGPYELLKRIEETGSLHQAAMDMKMSYRKAWYTLNAIEEKLGFALLNRQVGGASGGGSQITEAGRELMKDYEGFRNEVKESLETAYKTYFGKLNKQSGKHKD